jgi:hypothetical protein
MIYRITIHDIPGDHRDVGATFYNRSGVWYINPLSDQLYSDDWEDTTITGLLLHINKKIKRGRYECL